MSLMDIKTRLASVKKSETKTAKTAVSKQTDIQFLISQGLTLVEACEVSLKQKHTQEQAKKLAGKEVAKNRAIAFDSKVSVAKVLKEETAIFKKGSEVRKVVVKYVEIDGKVVPVCEGKVYMGQKFRKFEGFAIGMTMGNWKLQ